MLVYKPLVAVRSGEYVETNRLKNTAGYSRWLLELEAQFRERMEESI